MKGTPEPQAYTIAGAAIFLSLSVTQVKRLIKRGTLRSRKAGRRTLVLASDLTAYLESLPSSSTELPRGAGGRFVVHHISKSSVRA
jgi:excisionase family DNA binding protein